MTKLITENYFQTTINNEVLSSAVGEIGIQLNREPVGQFGILILDDEDNIKREEIFYHRKSGTTVYTYDVNRSNPKLHYAGASCVMNDSAFIFNFLSDNTYTHFYIYKKSINEVYVFGGKVYKDGVLIDITNQSLAIYNGINYIYLDDDQVIKQTLINPTGKVIVGLVTKSGSSITIEKYNIVGFGVKGDKGTSITSIEKISTVGLIDTYRINFNDGSNYTFTVTNGDIGPQGIQGIQGVQGNVGPQGSQGLTGNGIASITLLSTVGLVKTYRITYTDASTFDFSTTDGINGTNGTNGLNGSDGNDGRGIVSVVRTSGDGSPGTTDTYTITFTNTTTTTFQVYNGSNGAGGDMFKADNLSGLADAAIARSNLGVPAGSGTSTGSNSGDNAPNTNSGLMHTSGNETASGTKTFSDSVVFSQQIQRIVSGVLYLNASHATGEIRLRVNGGDRLLVSSAGVVTIGASYVAPTLDNEVATKKYVDDNAGGGGGSQTYEVYIAGELTTGRIFKQVVKTIQTLSGVKITTDTLPVGANLQVQVYKNGIASTNSIFTSDTPIEITTGQGATNGVYTTTKTTIDNGTLAENDVLYIYITQVGSTLSGTNLSVLVY